MNYKNILETSSISQAIALARRKVEDNLLIDALDICEAILNKFPMNRDSKIIIENIISDPSSNLLAEKIFQEGNVLYQKGDLGGGIKLFQEIG